jgi:hypothetical protein
MKNRNLLSLIIMGLSLILPFSLSPEPMEVFKSLHAETSPLPPSMPDRSEMNLVAFFATAEEGGFALSVALYDDPRTKWEVDYMELYDDEWDPLLISWIDRHGIVRLAVDRGLLEEESPELEGVLVFLTRGTPL